MDLRALFKRQSQKNEEAKRGAQKKVCIMFLIYILFTPYSYIIYYFKTIFIVFVLLYIIIIIIYIDDYDGIIMIVIVII